MWYTNDIFYTFKTVKHLYCAHLKDKSTHQVYLLNSLAGFTYVCKITIHSLLIFQFWNANEVNTFSTTRNLIIWNSVDWIYKFGGFMCIIIYTNTELCKLCVWFSNKNFIYYNYFYLYRIFFYNTQFFNKIFCIFLHFWILC